MCWRGDDRSSEHLESAEVRCDNRVLARAGAERRPAATPR